VIEFASVLILNCARTRRLADPHDDAPTRLASSFGRNRAATRIPRIFLEIFLAGCLLRQDNDGALKELLATYEDGNASWLYTRALVAFRESGDSDEEAARRARTGRVRKCA
jgi:hypothetical protein